MTDFPIFGSTDPRFDHVRATFAELFAEGLEQGGAVAVVLDGKPVVDLWGGSADSTGRAWQRDTLVNVWSTTKAVASLALAMLADRGQLDMARPVAEYWPEFAANGKGDITMDQVLSHQAGLDGCARLITLQEAYDPATFASALAEMAPLWPPGSRMVYHSFTLGALIAEPLRRIDGRSIGRFIAEEIAAPLGITFHLGLPQDQEYRVAELIAGPLASAGRPFVLASPYPRSAISPEVPALAPNTRAWRAAEMAGAGGHSDAISLARLFGGLADGTSPLISPAGMAAALQPRFDGVDALYQLPTRYAAGFRLSDVIYGPKAGAGSFGHAGWGGTMAFGDPQARLGFAFVTRFMQGFEDGVDPRRKRLVEAVYDAL